MPITVEWVDKPHILQLIYQGKLSLEEILAAWRTAIQLAQQDGQAPLCVLSVVMPDRELPVGLLKLSSDPHVSQHLKHIDMAVIVGVDHYLIGVLAEKLARFDDVPRFQFMDSYKQALAAMRAFVQTQQTGS